MIEREDYRKYLSVDNGKGLLIGSTDVYVLDKYSIDYFDVSNLKDLILIISNYIDDNYDSELDDLEEVLAHLLEINYYYYTKK